MSLFRQADLAMVVFTLTAWRPSLLPVTVPESSRSFADGEAAAGGDRSRPSGRPTDDSNAGYSDQHSCLLPDAEGFDTCRMFGTPSLSFHLALQFHLPPILTQHTDLPGFSRPHGCPEALEQFMRREKQQGRVNSRGERNEGGRQCEIIIA